MLNSGNKNILTLVFEKNILNETKNHNLQVKWSVPNKHPVTIDQLVMPAVELLEG